MTRHLILIAAVIRAACNETVDKPRVEAAASTFAQSIDGRLVSCDWQNGYPVPCAIIDGSKAVRTLWCYSALDHCRLD